MRRVTEKRLKRKFKTRTWGDLQCKYNNIEYENIYSNEEEFYYEFKLQEIISENDSWEKVFVPV